MRVSNIDLLDIDNVREEVDLADNAELQPIWLGHIINCGIQLVFTGTPDGEFQLQISNDPGDPHNPSESESYADVTNWTDVVDSNATISAEGNVYYELQNAAAEWVRVVWTASSPGTDPVLTVARAKVKGL
jgi:hypothetical protein